MGIARDRAMQLRSVYGIEGFASDGDLDVLLAAKGVEILTLSWSAVGLRELLVGRFLALRRGQSRDWERWLKAHALGHLLLHEGDQRQMPPLVVDRQEQQSEEFAGYLVIGEPHTHYSGYPVTTRSVASAARLPVECVDRWWNRVAGWYANDPRYVAARAVY